MDRHSRVALLPAFLFAGFCLLPERACAQAQPIEDVLVTSRRMEEAAQSVPIPLSVLTESKVLDSGSFNVGRLKELVPSLQFYSSNPRNTAVTIRGLGAPFGLTNDGIEPGVGMYVDGVYFARPASTTLDFLDVERIEVLRGPQGALYGKNTTAGAINIVTKKPSFTPEATYELGYGSYGFLQGKASISGPLSEKIAGRISFSGTQRDGTIRNAVSGDALNDLNNLGLRGQILYTPSEHLDITLSADFTRQRPKGYAQLVAGVAPTLRAANRQFAGIIADLGYAPASTNAFDRVTDTDTPWRSDQDLGGAALHVNWDVGPGTLTSISAYRFWKWSPSNDRDFLGLPITTLSQAPSKQEQVSQELRYAATLSPAFNVVVGAFAFRQTIISDPVQSQEQGSAAARFLLNPGDANYLPDLLTGYGQAVTIGFQNVSAALFGQADWEIADGLHILPGLRLNYDAKKGYYDSKVYGGPTGLTPGQIALQRSILAPQSYSADTDDTNVSGQLTISYALGDWANTYGTYATSFKSIGLNLGGLPNDSSGNPALSAATVKPEDERHFEFGIKTQPLPGVTANLTAFNTVIKNFQTQVTNGAVGVLRGYLANAEKVRVRGVEFDTSAQMGNLYLSGAAAYTEGVYLSFPDAPAPVELTGGPQSVDISGQRIPGLSRWAFSLSGEYTLPGHAWGEGNYFLGIDTSYRSSFSSSATPSAYLNVDGYALVNARIGFRGQAGWDAFFWVRNLTAQDYFEQLAVASGGSGLYVGQPGDPRTFGMTLRATY